MTAPQSVSTSWMALFRIFLRLGLTSFGGPVAHLGYFHEEFVRQRRWLTESDYANLVALCQFLPGPASSQVGIGLGMMRRGIPGGFAAWLGFTLPSAGLMLLFGYGIATWQDAIPPGMLDGLKAVAVAVVAHAVWGMGQRFCPDARLVTVAVLGVAGTLLIPSAFAPMIVIVLGGLAGALLGGDESGQEARDQAFPTVSHRWSIACVAVFALLLFGLPLVSVQWESHTLALINSFFRTGALVFGGGHVVLPLLQSTVVAPGWVTRSDFLSGYGAAQAVPGPLFSLSAYLGTVSGVEPNGWMGGLICLAAIYLPSFLLLIGVGPFWMAVKNHRYAAPVQAGVNAAVVGILLAALYDPIWTSTIVSARHFLQFIAAYALLAFWRLPSWAVVLISAVTGWWWLAGS